MTSPHVIYSLSVSSPGCEPLPPLPDIPRGSLVIVEGRASATRRCIDCAARPLPRPGQPTSAWVAVVVASHSQEWAVGQVVDVTLPAENSAPLHE